LIVTLLIVFGWIDSGLCIIVSRFQTVGESEIAGEL